MYRRNDRLSRICWYRWWKFTTVYVHVWWWWWWFTHGQYRWIYTKYHGHAEITVQSLATFRNISVSLKKLIIQTFFVICCASVLKGFEDIDKYLLVDEKLITVQYQPPHADGDKLDFVMRWNKQVFNFYFMMPGYFTNHTKTIQGGSCHMLPAHHVYMKTLPALYINAFAKIVRAFVN